MLDLPDEIFHLSVESLFRLMSKQVGMGAVGFDFRTDDQKMRDEFMNGTGVQVTAEEAAGAFR
ncbi:hypothetical protein Q0M94_19185 (plasmid) [Deinococcus radiomollis]|uniref:hypothetical protein n=1 Tax=Deinococcus radiomollis TaxID=468916 RepID=UPI0038912FBB